MAKYKKNQQINEKICMFSVSETSLILPISSKFKKKREGFFLKMEYLFSFLSYMLFNDLIQN